MSGKISIPELAAHCSISERTLRKHEADARRFWDDMRERFEEFSLSLNPDKTRLTLYSLPVSRRFANDFRFLVL